MRKLIPGFAFLLSLAILIYVPAAAAQGAAPAAKQLPDAPKPQSRPSAPAPAPESNAAASASQPAGPFKDQMEKYSYALGLSIGGTFKRQSLDLNVPSFDQGLKDALAGGKTLLTDEELKATMMQMQNDLKIRREERARQMANRNKEEGEAYLEANKTRPGVVVLPSGLQYKIITAGTGPKPAANDTVACNYRGTLINGTEFDSSARNGGPVSFPVNRVIKGWTEALQLMPVGSKWELYIPSTLAYGPGGAGQDIGPNSTLIFEVELVSIQGKQ